MKTLYDKLGVTRHANASDIEQSYRHSLSQHIAGNHSQPLRKKDQLRLQQMRQAYLILSSPSRRVEYDLKLDKLEHARLRRIERFGTVIGLVLLVAGLLLIARGYYRQVYDGHTSVQAASARDSAAAATRRHVTPADGDPSPQALNSRAD